MPIKSKSSSGSVMVEYTIAIVFLMIGIWYAVVGGDFSWMNPNTQNGTGTVIDRRDPDALALPGVANVLHDKQESFRAGIYQP